MNEEDIRRQAKERRMAEEYRAIIAMTDEQLQQLSANVSANLQDRTIPEMCRQIDLRVLIAVQVEQILRGLSDSQNHQS